MMSMLIRSFIPAWRTVSAKDVAAASVSGLWSAEPECSDPFSSRRCFPHMQGPIIEGAGGYHIPPLSSPSTPPIGTIGHRLMPSMTTHGRHAFPAVLTAQNGGPSVHTGGEEPRRVLRMPLEPPHAPPRVELLKRTIPQSPRVPQPHPGDTGKRGVMTSAAHRLREMLRRRGKSGRIQALSSRRHF
jgi:hypothetical protein